MAAQISVTCLWSTHRCSCCFAYPPAVRHPAFHQVCFCRISKNFTTDGDKLDE